MIAEAVLKEKDSKKKEKYCFLLGAWLRS